MIAKVPRLFVHTGIWLCAFNCILRAELAPVLLVCAEAGVETMTSAAEAASAVTKLRMLTPWLDGPALSLLNRGIEALLTGFAGKPLAPVPDWLRVRLSASGAAK
jgi:hypothetical protein